MLPSNTNKILQFLGFTLDVDFIGSRNADGYQLTWLSQQTQPTEQEIVDAGNDLTLIDGINFSTWFAEHGGDADLTRRRLAKELLDKIDEQNQLLRAVVIAVNARTNQIADRLNQVLDGIDSGNNLAQLQANIGAIADLPIIQKSELRTEIFSRITSSESDGQLS